MGQSCLGGRNLSADGVVAPSQEPRLWICAMGLLAALADEHLPAASLGSAFCSGMAQGGPGWMPYLKCAAENIPWGELYAQRMGISCYAHLTPRAVGSGLKSLSLLVNSMAGEGGTRLDSCSRGSWTRGLLRELLGLSGGEGEFVGWPYNEDKSLGMQQLLAICGAHL